MRGSSRSLCHVACSAGAISEIARYTLAKDFRHIDPSRSRIVLVEGEPRVLASFPESEYLKGLLVRTA